MMDKEAAFQKAKEILDKGSFTIISQDNARPWGGFYVIEESQAEAFAQQFFPEENFNALKISEKLSPKILIVGPGKRLSWQYHNRRAEIWRCIDGEVAVAISETDAEQQRVLLRKGDTIKLPQGRRHRLIGLDGWGLVAEIWQHTDAAHPSDEEDIVRLQDDFGR